MSNTKKVKVVFFTGAGVSAESGIKTFRDMGGMWEQYDVLEVASIEGWRKNPQLVLDFYNTRFRDGLTKVPNRAHEIIAELEADYDVYVVTQNVDDLHERAGSTKVLHLHGKLNEMKDAETGEIFPYKELKVGDMSPDGNQLRPNIVWFGENVYNIQKAIDIVKAADVLVTIGTSLLVQPAAGLVRMAENASLTVVIDPNFDAEENNDITPVIYLKPATEGMPEFKELLDSIYKNTTPQ